MKQFSFTTSNSCCGALGVLIMLVPLFFALPEAIALFTEGRMADALWHAKIVAFTLPVGLVLVTQKTGTVFVPASKTAVRQTSVLGIPLVRQAIDLDVHQRVVVHSCFSPEITKGDHRRPAMWNHYLELENADGDNLALHSYSDPEIALQTGMRLARAMDLDFEHRQERDATEHWDGPEFRARMEKFHREFEQERL